MLLEVLLALFAVCRSGHSQLITTDVSQYAHTSWGARDGAFRGNINAITQTNDGYIWLGTGFGLLRFDGVRFTPANPVDGINLGQKMIGAIAAGTDGSLWLGVDGLRRLKDGRLTPVPELRDTMVQGILVTKSGDVWAGGLNRHSDNKVCRIRDAKAVCFGGTSLFGILVHGLALDEHDHVFVLAETGVWRYSDGSFALVKLSNGTVLTGRAHNISLPVGSVEGISAIRSALELIDRENINLGSVPNCKFFVDDQGGVWIGTNGHGVVHVFGQRIDSFTAQDGLSGDTVVSILQDHEGDIWVSTVGGLDRFRPLPVVTLTSKQGLLTEAVNSVLVRRDTLLVATGRGLNGVTKKGITDLTSTYKLPKGAPLTTLFADRNSLLVSASFEDSLYRSSPQTAVRIKGVYGSNTFKMTEDGADGVWATNREVGLLHIIGNQVAEVIPWARFDNHIATTIAYDHQRRGLWLALQGGDLEFVQDGGVKRRYSIEQHHPFENPEQLQVKPDGTVWVSSSAGISRLSGEHLATLSSKNGLPCEGAHWQVEDANNSSWIELSCGLIHLPPGELERWSAHPDTRVKFSQHFSSVEGAEEVSIGHHYSPTAAIFADHFLIFVTLSGLGIVDVNRDFTNRLPPPIHIEGIEGDARRYPLAPVITLPANVHVVRLTYSALTFRAPQKALFRYKLDGYDRDWNQGSDGREAIYTNLPHGSYCFRVIACNESGVWNETGATIQLVVAAAYYQTKWFFLACSLAAILALWLIYYARMVYVCRELSVRLDAKANERVSIARELHDTLLQGMQGLILSVHALSIDSSFSSSTKMRIAQIAGRAEEVLIEGRENIRRLRSEESPKRHLISEVDRVISGVSPSPSVTLRTTVEGNERPLVPLVLEEIVPIVREAVQNAVNHANASVIEVWIRFGRKRFSIEIRDDGQGIPQNAVETPPDGHWGIRGMRERAASLGAELIFKRTDPKRNPPGTTLVVELPSGVAYLRED